MKIFYHVSWRRNTYAGGFKCNSDTIRNGTLISGEGSLTCHYGCTGTITQMAYYCTDYSVEDNWSFGERGLTYNFSQHNTITLSFTGCCWISPFYSSSWNISTTFSTVIRNDTGKVNSSPYVVISPVVRLQQDCNYTIPLAVSDSDGDIIRCRWAVDKECAGICNAFPGAILNYNSCTINYQATKGTGYKAAAMMIEDFIPGSQYPLSSVALQFLVFVVSSNETCSSQPEFIEPTLPSGLCLAIPPGRTFSTQLMATSHSTTISIIEIQTVSPFGMIKGGLQKIQDRSSYYVNISWKPTADQENETHIFCFTAVNSKGLASMQHCLELLAGKYPPIPYPTIDKAKYQPSNVILHVRINKIVKRPSKPAFIRFFEFISEKEVYKIDASLSQEITFNNSKQIHISPSHSFAEKNMYFINFDRGIMQSMEGCGPVNEAVINKMFSFEVIDITLPVITPVDPSTISNGTIGLHWKANENVTWECKLTSHNSESIVNCSEGRWTEHSLSEGTYKLTINATDDADNIAVYVHTFTVDLTPPEVNIIQQPRKVSNQKSSTIGFTCNELHMCSFQCQFYIVEPGQIENSTTACNNGAFTTPTLDHNATYTIVITATDQVGNRGNPVTYEWETDFEAPQISGVSNLSVSCSDTSPSNISRAQVTDDKSAFPSVAYSDVQLGCLLERTWTAMDEAGNIAYFVQHINLVHVPTLSFLAQLSFSCDSTLGSIQIPPNTATAPNPCGLPLRLSHEDSISVKVCPSEFVRNWTVTVCNTTVSQLQNITIFDLCPPYACGKNESIPQGVCSFGECQCNAPWYGEDCSTLIYEPLVRPVNNSILQEAQQYFVSLTLLQGTQPLSWNVITGPRRLKVDQYSGEVSWDRAEAGNFTVSIRVENQVGFVEVIWTLKVQPGYSTKLNQVNPTLYSYAMPIMLTGSVEYVQDNVVRDFLVGIVPVFIDIVSNGAIITLRTFTAVDGNFSVIFYPAVKEYGSYQAGSRHPGVSKSTPQANWGILGLKAMPNHVYLTGEAVKEFEKTFYNVTTVCNDGPATLSGIRLESSFSNSDGVRIEILEKGLLSKNVLEQGGKFNVDLKIVSSEPLSGFFIILVVSSEGTLIQIDVSLQIEPILPTFLIQPPSINSRIVRGRSRVFEFNITNTGRTVANTVRPLLPNTDIISFISFGNDSGLDLSSGESAVLSILVQTPEVFQLGDISSSIAIISAQISTTIPIRLIVASDVLMNLTVIVEDEFTYFASGEPLVDDAVITLINYQRDIRISMTTEGDNGSATFLNIYEDRYELFIEAPDHFPLHQIIVKSLDNPTLVVFIQRQTVTYTWSVTPVEFQDTYILTVEADFVAHVPIPVVTVTPREFDLEELELGFISSIQLNITNHGLIRANDTSIELPSDHPFLEFSVPSKELGYLDPLSSAIVTIQISHKNIRRRIAPAALYAANVLYSYICGERQDRSIPILFKKDIIIEPASSTRTPITHSIIPPTRTPVTHSITPPTRRPIMLISNLYRSNCPSCSSGVRGRSGFSFHGYSSSTKAFCNKCIQAILGCLPGPQLPFTNCIPLFSGEGSLFKVAVKMLKWIECLADDVIRNNKVINTISKFSKKINPVLEAFRCGYAIGENCIVPRGNKRSLDTVIQDLVGPILAISQSIDAAVEVLGDERWLLVGDKNWVTQIIKPTLDDNSEAGVLISKAELFTILSASLPNGTTIEMVTSLIERLNNTLQGWSSGQLEPSEGFNMASFKRTQELTQNISIHNDVAVSKGFSSYLDAFNFASAEFNKIDDLEEGAGVCAIVRIRIEQELAVTRVAFIAKLEIENKESSSLVRGSLEIIIFDSDTGVQSTHLFAIGNETLSGSFTAGNEGWSLPSEGSGSVEWLIIPYSEAAPKSDRTYDVGGILRYSLDNESITIRLLPAPITVTPDPSLLVHYFWERYVIGDDPFTDERENSVPFTLGVAVKNAGHGTASSLQITSGQPEIVENKKGLLVNFNIIGAFIGNEMISSSLTVMFGDLFPGSTVVARWQMVSSLQGEFRNYSATFENINPLGDPNLSILDELEIHELIRSVKIYGTSEDDEVLDFLVNELNDAFTYPDMLYSSKSLYHYNVTVGVVLSVRSLTTFLLEVKTVSNHTGWVYYRYEDTQGLLSSTAFTLNSTKQEGTEAVSIPPENSWITREDSSGSNNDLLYLHIVDNITTTDEIIFIMELCSTNCSTKEISYSRAETGLYTFTYFTYIENAAILRLYNTV